MAQIYISLGSNIDRDKNIRAGLDALYLALGDLVLSQVYESEAVGFDGSHFLNLVAGAETDLSISELDELFKYIESKNGRVRGGAKFAPRTLDIDLLLYDQLITDTGVILPREEILHNAFVLLPLAEIATELKHPLAGKTYQQLWQGFPQDSQQLWSISFDWNPKQI